MRSLFQLLADVALMLAATLIAAALRDDFALSRDRLAGIAPYVGFTLASAIILFPTLGLSKAIWRFTALRDLLVLTGGVLAVVLAAVAMSFAFNRLEGVPRSLPILQIMTALLLMTALRVALRVRHAARARPVQFVANPSLTAQEHVLIVGLTRLADVFLKAANETKSTSVNVVGIVGQNDRHAGQAFDRIPILGTTEEIASVVQNLEVHGIAVNRILVAMPFRNLSEAARESLLAIERGSTIRVEFISELLGLSDQPSSGDTPPADTEDLNPLSVTELEATRLAQRPYWRLKRGLDVVCAAGMLVLLAPLMAVVAILTALDVGWPVTFWQRRPGLGGRPFWLVKFRTMNGAHDRQGRRIADDKRLSRVGRFMRASRLDELPQLVNILVGDMSFIGPRPLLPVDQAPEHSARLMIRPGLTGWAQVMGGRDVAKDDKAAMDVWYLKNASLLLDLKILWLTFRMIAFGEKVSQRAIASAWADLQAPTQAPTEVSRHGQAHIAA